MLETPDKKIYSQKEIDELMGSLVDLLVKFKSKDLPENWAKNESITYVYNYIRDIKESLAGFAEGQLDFKLKQTGATAGIIKSLKAGLNHLAWQLRTVADGDLSQRVDYLGDFSLAFNKMANSLGKQRKALEEQQEQLSILTIELQKEIKERDGIENALRTSEETYRQMALRDPLTGIHNRGYFFEAAIHELEHIKRHGGEACLLMIDVDYFKKFNDTFGHISGDEALISLTSAISATLRKTDLFARYGGEEFILYLQMANLQTGLEIAERIRNLIADLAFPATNVPTPITISIGVSFIDGQNLLNNDKNIEAILNSYILQADLALYQAKELGRNRVEFSIL